MEKDKRLSAKIRISGMHSTENSNDDVSEEYTGTVSKKTDNIYIIYEAPAGIRNMIKIEKSGVSITKSCTYHGKRRIMTELTYSLGKRIPGSYETPYGNMEIETETEQLKTAESEKSVNCRIKGKLMINGSFVSDFKLNIEAAVF